MRSLLVLSGLLALASVMMERPVDAVQATPAGPAIRTNKEGNDFAPPATREAWLLRRSAVRRRILTACGLNPMPARTPLRPQVYGLEERDGYTVEKVVLETLPGFYVSGNLYRPKNASGPAPGILNPHGHWQEGRFNADVQARCAAQARMGAVAFQWDMVGYADSKAFGHSFADDELTALGLNLPGLQLWNSIRVLDWFSELQGVDRTRIACTGESGGGTQTFLLCAIDDRIAVAAPVCMVSHHFQGGSQCENAPHLRLGTDNVEFAAVFAPKPQILIGATGDWTSQIQQKGVPELKAVYRLFDAEDRLEAVVHDAGHNYNQQSRESVYAFFRKHLWGEKEPGRVREREFKAETPEALTTWDDFHPRPPDAATPEQLKAYLRTVVEKQVSSWKPESPEQWGTNRGFLKDALETILAVEPVPGGTLHSESSDGLRVVDKENYRSETVTLAPRKGMPGTRLTWLTQAKKLQPNSVTVLVHPRGSTALLAPNGSPGPLVAMLLKNNHGVAILEPFMAGANEQIAARHAAQYFTCYNRTTLSVRAQGIVDAAAFGRRVGTKVNLIGFEDAGAWVLLARPFAGEIRRTAVDGRWEWPRALPASHPNYFPSVHRYGGLKAFAALAAPDPLLLFNQDRGMDTSWLTAAYGAGEMIGLRVDPGPISDRSLVAWID